jgi:extradiol dioxygenase family protein
MLGVQGVTHWSLPVNDLEEAERFYGELLGFESRGRLGSGRMSCFNAGGHDILLTQRHEAREQTPDQVELHYSFTVTPEVLEEACRVFLERGVKVESLVYRDRGYFLGRELYFLDPSGNRLELRDPTWQPGMPIPSWEEIARQPRVTA